MGGQQRMGPLTAHEAAPVRPRTLLPTPSIPSDLTRASLHACPTLQLPAIVEARFGGQASATQSGNVRTVAVEKSTDEPDDPFGAPASVFESKDHYMHGTLHANGFGHLDRMNARELPGPERLTGQQLMALWDALCTLLAAREVSVEDVSNKSGMLLRTLHTVAYGTTW